MCASVYMIGCMNYVLNEKSSRLAVQATGFKG